MKYSEKKAISNIIRAFIRKLRAVAGITLRTEKRERFREFRWPLKFAIASSHLFGKKPLKIGLGFEYVKRRTLRRVFPDYSWVFLPFGKRAEDVVDLLPNYSTFEPWVWSYRDTNYEVDYFAEAKKIVRVEDGFLRSHGLGNSNNPSYSYAIDENGLYFNGMVTSDHEIMCSEYRFAATDLTKADEAIERFKNARLTKYNLKPAADTGALFHGCERQNTVLVVGQVEDDQSIQRNDSIVRNNETLLTKAMQENPGANIFYKPHPDVANGFRQATSAPEKVDENVRIIGTEHILPNILDHVGSVYTISSLSGFEALLRGADVYVFGRPFYAGWGLTHDALTFDRRNRVLSLEQLFFITYLKYPIYFDPITGQRIQFEDLIERLTGNNSPSAKN